MPAADPAGTPLQQATIANSGEQQQLFQCDFGPAFDRNFDQWPDGWVREVSAKYPHYLRIGINRPVTDTEGNKPSHALRVELDGGAAWIRSPEVAINPLFMYAAEVNVRMSKLERNACYLSLSFFDAKQQLIERVTSIKLQSTSGWQQLRIAPTLPGKNTIAFAKLGLHVEPIDKASDLRGWVEFTQISLNRLPRITLTSSRKDRIYFDPDQPEIICQASGFHDPQARVVFELLDIHDQLVMRDELLLRKQNELTTEPKSTTTEHTPVEEKSTTTTGNQTEPGSDNIQRNGVYSGEVQWRPKIKQPGYYRVRVQMPGELGIVNRRELSLIILKPLPALPHGEFGWSLPQGEYPLSLSDLSDLAGASGVHWLKLPIWSAGTDRSRANLVIWFAERLSLKRINLVGMLSDPPAQVRTAVSGGQVDLAAGVFSAPEQIWFPTLEPIISRLSARVQYWQLGNDQDQSFVGFNDGPARVQTIRKLFSRFGQSMHFTIGWDWLRELPTEKTSWDTVVLDTKPVLSAAELTAMLQLSSATSVKRWVMVEPLPATEYSTETRIADLVQRMVAAKAGQATGIFLPRLCDDQTGILNADGSGGPLYIPWRNACYQLAGTQYVGQLQLDSGARNAIFARQDEYVMVLWGDQVSTSTDPQFVELQLGPGIQVSNCWGQSIAVTKLATGVKVPIGPQPIFVTNFNGGIARLQINLQFANKRWASVFDQPQSNAIEMINPFDQAISGQVRINWPEEWKTKSRELSFKIAPHDAIQIPFDIKLPLYAGTGRQSIQLEFQIDVDRTYQFRTSRDIEIGLDDLFAEFTTSINPKGELEVEQRMTNRTTETVNFKSYLFAPDRKRMTLQIQDQGQGIDVRTFVLARGNELVGKDLQIRLIEVGGDRVLNYVIKVKP